MRRNYYQDDRDDESELPDLDFLARQNLFSTDDEVGWGASHNADKLPDDNAITHQDPNARLGRDLA